MANAPVVDPWLVNADGSIDPFSRNIDFGMSSQDEIEDPETITPTVLQPEIIGHQPPAPVAPVPVPVPVVEPQEPEGPEITELENGGRIILEKEKGQWKATLDPGNGANAEVFWGKSKNSLLANVLGAKLNATKKIRDLNKQLKLGNQTAKPAPVKPTPIPQSRELTADELFEIQTELQANPDKALESWFQKKTGLSVNQLVEIAKRGAAADAELRIESVSREFLGRNPDYYPDDRNVEAVVRWLGKYKIGNPSATMFDLDAAGQWKATLDPGNGANAEVFWGKNKNGLMTNVLKAKLNATKKIRDLNKQLKLGNQAVKAAPVKPSPVPQTRELTADELFEIQTELQANPDKALETWFQKKTGLSVTQLVDIAKRGAVADAELRIESISREFLSRNPDYYPDDRNVETIVRWLGKYKIGNPAATMYDLDAAGQWTIENLEEAFADLSDDGLLVKAPKPPKAPRQAEITPPVPVPSEQVPAPRLDERIVRTETRPRAALGIRTSDLTPVAPPEAPTAPSDDDLDNMSDAQIAQLLGGVKRMRIQTRRSN